VRAGLIWLVEELTDALGAFEREGGVERTPGEGDAACSAMFGLFTRSQVEDALEVAVERFGVEPGVRVCGDAGGVRRAEKDSRYIFKGNHNKLIAPFARPG